jgi:hypothetical protein
MENFGVLEYVSEAYADDDSIPPPADERKNKKKPSDNSSKKPGKIKMSISDTRQNKTFRKIEQDLKNKHKRRQKVIQEELETPKAPTSEMYVDKDRGIAVGIGKIMTIFTRRVYILLCCCCCSRAFLLCS